MRKLAFGSIVLLLVTLGWGGRSVGEQPPAPRGELRVVDKHHFNWAHIVLNIFEHLFELDREGKMVPGLATQWRWLDDRTVEFTLRQGVKFHNGEVFDAEIVKLNWDENLRLKQPFVSGEFMNFKPGVTAGDPRSAHDPVHLSRARWWGTRPALDDAYGQPPISRGTRLGGEALVNPRPSWPVGHGAV
jgi:hypothetical protein